MYRQVIEHAGIPVGIAIPDNDKLRFIAVKYHVIDLDNQRFATVEDLRNTIRQHVATANHMAA